LSPELGCFALDRVKLLLVLTLVGLPAALRMGRRPPRAATACGARSASASSSPASSGLP